MNLGEIHRIKKTNQMRGGDGDVWLGRLVKLIPAEALVIYPIGKAATSSESIQYWPIVVAFIILVLRFFTISGGSKLNKFISIFISMVTFIIWVLANGDAFGPIKPEFQYSKDITVWGGLAWLVIASAIFKGD